MVQVAVIFMAVKLQGAMLCRMQSEILVMLLIGDGSVVAREDLTRRCKHTMM